MSVHYQKEDFYLNELPQDFIEEFELYLKTNRKCGHNTTIKYLANFKKITRLSLARGWLNKDPFSEYKFHLKPVERDFLEWHELQRLKDKHIDIPRMAQIRDIFVFCCFTGLAFSDVKQLRPEHIVLDINGARWIRKSRQKRRTCVIFLCWMQQMKFCRAMRTTITAKSAEFYFLYAAIKDEFIFEGIGRYMRYSKASIHPHGSSYFRHAYACQRSSH